MSEERSCEEARTAEDEAFIAWWNHSAEPKHVTRAAFPAGAIAEILEDALDHLQTFPCPSCDGSGVDGSHDAAVYYAERGDISACSNCHGTGRDLLGAVTNATVALAAGDRPPAEREETK